MAIYWKNSVFCAQTGFFKVLEFLSSHFSVILLQRPFLVKLLSTGRGSTWLGGAASHCARSLLDLVF